MEAQALRPESIQYIAISFADERWDRGIGYDFEADETGDQMIDFAVSWFEQAGHRPYEDEVIARLGEILLDSAKYPGAVKALRYALGRDPLAPNAPQLQLSPLPREPHGQAGRQIRIEQKGRLPANASCEGLVGNETPVPKPVDPEPGPRHVVCEGHLQDPSPREPLLSEDPGQVDAVPRPVARVVLLFQDPLGGSGCGG